MTARKRQFSERRVRDAMEALLEGSGDDIRREGLRGTPDRYARFLREWMRPEPFAFTTFDAEGASQMIVQAAIPFYSLCEHHLLPFVGTAVVGYLPDRRVVGLSKLARAVQHCAKGFQNQERITERVADMILENVRPKGVGVILRAEHFCMAMRGARAVGSTTLTCALRGLFQDDLMVRTEFMAWATEAKK